jgi:hypothetical protein
MSQSYFHCFFLVTCVASTLKMEAVRSAETSMNCFYRKTQSGVPEDGTFHVMFLH